MKIGVLPLGRPTFDVPYAEEKLSAMLGDLDTLAHREGHELIGSRRLLMDLDAARDALADCAGADFLLVLQVTFTDASFVIEASNALSAPMGIWAVPEPRLGGRLRLNAFCGLNLASHALGLNRKPFGWLYGEAGQVDLKGLLNGAHRSAAPVLMASEAKPEPVPEGLKIAQIGAHPDGFDTCRYEATALAQLGNTQVTQFSLEDFFDKARTLSEEALAPIEAKAAQIPNLKEMDAGELNRSLRLAGALEALQKEGKFDAFAIRCWPETFTEYGGAVCGPVSMMGEARVPCACEADVYGALTSSILQKIADAPVFLADIVDMDITDDTGVVWHCGQAPTSMAASTPMATVHTNRKQALLYEFPLKAGRVTLFRISQARGVAQVIYATGEMMARPMAFTGTSGVVRFDQGTAAVLEQMMGAGLEHHMALVYGDHKEAIEGVASAYGLPILELGA